MKERDQKLLDFRHSHQGLSHVMSKHVRSRASRNSEGSTSFQDRYPGSCYFSLCSILRLKSHSSSPGTVHMVLQLRKSCIFPAREDRPGGVTANYEGLLTAKSCYYQRAITPERAILTPSHAIAARHCYEPRTQLLAQSHMLC